MSSRPLAGNDNLLEQVENWYIDPSLSNGAESKDSGGSDGKNKNEKHVLDKDIVPSGSKTGGEAEKNEKLYKNNKT